MKHLSDMNEYKYCTRTNSNVAKGSHVFEKAILQIGQAFFQKATALCNAHRSRAHSPAFIAAFIVLAVDN
jgi:hypothetical protein